MTRPLLVTTTFKTQADAEKVAMALLNQGLVACARISGPSQSFYWWKGKVESAEEFVLELKTEATLYTRVEEELKKIHPYELPEIVATNIDQLSTGYRQWMEEALDLD